MQEKDSKKKEQGILNSWLDAMQQNSWQLELLVSGFVIFLLIGGWEPIDDLEYDLYLLLNVSESYSTLELIYNALRTAYLSLLGCLMIHVVMRGLWIAAIGLRSISGDIDYDAFNYEKRFVDRLRHRLGSFDHYIERLERNCSVIFSLAFLIVFCFISLITWAIAAIGIQFVFSWVTGMGQGSQGPELISVPGIFSLLMLVVSIIYLIDFATLGLFKRLRWVNRPYYYLYVFMGWVTLAWLYRPLYYNLIDNKFGRRLAIMLPFVIVLIMAAVSLKQIKYTYFPYYGRDGTVLLDHNNYDDENPTPLNQISRMSLASRYTVNNYMEAFIPYRPRWDDEVLTRLDSTLDISRYTGIKLYGAFQIGTRYNRDADYDPILKAFGQSHKLYLNDSLLTDIEPLFTMHEQRRQPGTVYMLPTHDLPLGRQELRISKRYMENDSLKWSDGYTVYFYK
jgi:hypothetical protein